MEINGRLDENHSDNTMEDIHLSYSSSPPTYDPTFEDSIMQIVLEPNSHSSILTQSDNSLSQNRTEPFSNNSAPFNPSSISSRLLNHLRDDPLGCPALSSTPSATLASSFVRQHDIHSREQMQLVIAAEIRVVAQELEKRMEARCDAAERNAKVRREIEEVIVQREVERRMERRALDEAVKRREKREEKEKVRMARRKG